MLEPLVLPCALTTLCRLWINWTNAVCNKEFDPVDEVTPDALDDALRLLSRESSTLPLDVPLDEEDEEDAPSNAPIPPP